YDYIDTSNGGTVPNPPPLNFSSFTDTDPDAGEASRHWSGYVASCCSLMHEVMDSGVAEQARRELEVGGALTWTVDGTYNIGYDYTALLLVHVVGHRDYRSHYAIFLASDSAGSGGFELARVTPGSLSYTIPDNTDQQGNFCLLMYGYNTHGIAASPSFFHCFEAGVTATTTSATGHDLGIGIGNFNSDSDPYATIISVGFTDTSVSYGYWIDGTVTWVAQNNPDVEYFRIVMVLPSAFGRKLHTFATFLCCCQLSESATSSGDGGAIMVDNLAKTATDYEIVNSDARGIVRGTDTGGVWANYIVVMTYGSLASAGIHREMELLGLKMQVIAITSS
ncbi:unnamed protein product, partial [Symbiodinium natans]